MLTFAGLQTLAADDPRAKDLPTIVLSDGRTVVDTLAMFEGGMKWGEVAQRLGPTVDQWNAVVFSYVVEIHRDPTLYGDASPERIVALRRESNQRWLRIAVRSGLATKAGRPAEAQAKAIFQDATGIDPSTTYVKRGRHFAEARRGEQPVETSGEYIDRVKTVRKVENIRGDEPVASKAVEIIDAERKRVAQEAIAAAKAKRAAKAK